MEIVPNVLIATDNKQLSQDLVQFITSKFCVITHTAFEINELQSHLNEFKFMLVVVDDDMPHPSKAPPHIVARNRQPNAVIFKLLPFLHEEDVKRVLKEERIDGYLQKPLIPNLAFAQISSIISDQFHRDISSSNAVNQSTIQQIQGHLENLNVDVGAYRILLLQEDGYLVAQAGNGEALDILSISTLITANVSASTELSLLLKNDTPFESSHYTGSKFSIYTCKINDMYLLSTVYGISSKLGAVRFYTRELTPKLISLLNMLQKETKAREVNELLSTDLLDKELQLLFSI